MHWRRKWQPPLVFLPGESQGGGAWWAAVYGVAQSRTRLSDLTELIAVLYLYIYIWRRQWHPTPVLLPGKSHGRRILVGYNAVHGVARCRTRLSNFTFTFHFHFSLSCIGEGNGNPLQCSYLENPRDGGAWWAAFYEVTQSQTQLKRLSSSSSSIKH